MGQAWARLPSHPVPLRWNVRPGGRAFTPSPWGTRNLADGKGAFVELIGQRPSSGNVRSGLCRAPWCGDLEKVAPLPPPFWGKGGGLKESS